MKEGIIKLNEQQATTLLELLNIANKAAGLQVAENCLFFVQTINAAFETKKAPLSESTTEEVK